MTDIFKDDYNNTNGFMTSIWGPPLWMILHIISFNYPIKPTIEDKNNYYNYILSLKNILPCKYCRDNFLNNLKKINFTKKSMISRESFSYVIYQLHKEVNNMLGKKCNLTYNQVRNMYENFRARCITKDTKTKFEKGCKKSLYGIKSKCQINIVPKKNNSKSLKIDKTCILKLK